MDCKLHKDLVKRPKEESMSNQLSAGNQIYLMIMYHMQLYADGLF